MRGALALGVLLGTLVAAPLAQESPFLTLLSADIEELVPPGRGRQVVFRLRVSEPAPCDASRAGVSYAFLIDADRSTTTGARTLGFPELGIDRTLIIGCDPTSGRFTSDSGPVTTGRPFDATDTGWELSVALPFDRIPSREFRWIAVAREGSQYDRLPAVGRAGAWRVDMGFW